MQVEKKDLEKGQIELTVEVPFKEFEPFLSKGANILSKEVKIDGFRSGAVPYDVLKQKVGEMAILEESARAYINKYLGGIIEKNVERQAVGQPKINITKMAPGNPLEFKVTMALLPEITLGEYKSLNIRPKKIKVEDRDIENTLEQIKEMRASEKIVDRAVSSGDKAMVDIQMFLDKVPVDGGQSANTAVLLGKDYIVPGLDKKLEGAKKGETREFSLSYPREHHMKNLAGKMVDFRVKINEVYERVAPEMNDEFAAALGTKNMQELRQNIKKSIEQQKSDEAAQDAERQMLEKIIDKSRFGDIPEMLIRHEARNMMSEIEHNVAQQGGKFEDYLASIKKSRDQLMLDMMPNAVKRVKSSLLIREIAKKENISADDEEIKKSVEEMKKTAKGRGEDASRLDSEEFERYMANALTSQKVVDKLKEWNIEK